jgi:hypothetical protein
VGGSVHTSELLELDELDEPLDVEAELLFGGGCSSQLAGRDDEASDAAELADDEVEEPELNELLELSAAT